ncbi:undecaprenyl-diphosphatase [Sulfitobacter brevis]|jgi:undecaprenyl-diphosphatase|uniref:Undecaprenyl-diphosphatase n=1 Tax=Sulfitobacter brevis TaxID=74348 RepID=A0A1I2G957_9RHOB|nr:LssY C-terminal domain-containing protein [Sulfitobacter brevis]SFF13487.1 undecaprenyl-diphosphatase [Sulfitobacter brevis]
MVSNLLSNIEAIGFWVYWVIGLMSVLLLLWFLISRLRRSWSFLSSVLGSVALTVRDNQDFRALFARCPKLFYFLTRRVSRQTFSGLPATFLGLAFLYFLGLYVESVLRLLDHGSLVQADSHISSLVLTVRSDGLTRFFTIVTGLGYWQAAILVGLAATILMWIWDRRHYIPTLWFTLVCNVISVWLLKLVFARARPDVALYVESSYAFPSGHSATIATLSVFLTYVLVRERIGQDLFWILSCFTLVFLVGLSRVYLGEHFLSDVLNGYLVGTLWAITGIFLAERLGLRQTSSGMQVTGAGRWWATAGVIAVTTILLGFVLEDYSRTLRHNVPTCEAQLSVPIDKALREGILPTRSESMIGTSQEPVSLILYFPDDTTLLDAMAAAGWQHADPPGVVTLSRAAIAAWLDRPYETAPITSVFLNGWPQDFGFQKALTSEGLRRRHYARFWRIRMQESSDLVVFVGTVSFDVGSKSGLTHRIDPNVDAERDLLVADLLRNGGVQQDGRAKIVAQLLDQNVFGDQYYTGGRAVILSILNATVGPRATE